MSSRRYKRNCLWCSKLFVASRSDAKFCDAKCKGKYNYTRKLNEQEEDDVFIYPDVPDDLRKAINLLHRFTLDTNPNNTGANLRRLNESYAKWTMDKDKAYMLEVFKLNGLNESDFKRWWEINKCEHVAVYFHFSGRLEHPFKNPEEYYEQSKKVFRKVMRDQMKIHSKTG